MNFGVGQPVARKEDPRFLTGRGLYVSDIELPRQTYGVFIYSSYAHAKINSIDTTEAAKAPGIVAILTGKDWTADKLGSVNPEAMPEDFGGPKGHRTQHWPLAIDKVRYVGERVALVIGETEAQARDAADLVNIDYELLPTIVRATDAVKDGAPLVYEESPKNTCFTLRMGNVDAVEPAFAAAAHVTKIELFNNRLNAFTMEPRGCIGAFDDREQRYTLYTSTQNVHGVRKGLSHIYHVPEDQLRVIAKDVGGGFGMKGNLYPEEVVLPWAAKKIRRPIKWIATRSEALLGDDQGRDLFVTAELALDKDGRFLALRWKGLHNVGAYIEGSGIVPVMFVMKLAPSVYDIPAVAVFNSAVFTNTPPTIPYRGAGRPEAVYIIERLIDQAAHEMKIDRAEIRKRNFIQPAAMPYATKTGWTYDTGDFNAAMTKAQGLSDWEGYETRKTASEKAGKKRGRGIVAYIDNTGIFNDRMEIRFDPSGRITVHSGMLNHGQGHETTFAQMVSEWLSVPFDSIRLVQADTDEVAYGRGTYASRSTMVGGSALRAAADNVIEKGKKFAAHFMEANPADISFADGKFTITGTDKSMPLLKIAAMSSIPMGLPAELGVGLRGDGAFTANVPSFPNGCHVCEVEVDPDTGTVVIDRYTVVDDIGTVINPMLAEGQVQGGVVQGMGQALLEDIIHDENGQFLTGSLMDYAVPRASDMPYISVGFSPVPSKSNPLGVKGVGEGGTVAATPTVLNAVIDALKPYGVVTIPMPATPERVWQAVKGGIIAAAAE